MKPLFLFAMPLLLLLLSGCTQEKQRAGDVLPALQPDLEKNRAMRIEVINDSGAQPQAQNVPAAVGNTASGANNSSEQRQISVPYYIMLSKEGEMCGGAVGFACEQGLDCVLAGNQTGAGGICCNPKWNETAVFHNCPLKRGGLCLPGYKPVCGRYSDGTGSQFYKDYPNSCLACSKSSNALGYFDGRCSKLGR